MLTRLKVNGFKNLVDVDVRFGPFTCIAGENGVGKSNLFDAIRFLSALADHTFMEASRAVRDESGRAGDGGGVFHRQGEWTADLLSFTAEMIVPPSGTDDLGRTATAAATFLRYALQLGRRNEADESVGTLELISEELSHVKSSEVGECLTFPTSDRWRRSALKQSRRRMPFLSTEGPPKMRVVGEHPDGKYQTAGLSHARKALRTVLSTSTAHDRPTAFLARREMQSWGLLRLEPTALRKPDEFSSPARLAADGSHLPATLYRLSKAKRTAAGGTVYEQVALRLNQLIRGVKDVRVERDQVRELFRLIVTDREGTPFSARALSDGTLRFLALAVLELDPEARGLVCFEEPENGIHPQRIPAMIRLLKDIATDTQYPVDADNPLRQVIVNTHSPAVVAEIEDADLLWASGVTRVRDGRRQRSLGVRFLDGTWRAENWDEADGRVPVVSRGELRSYLWSFEREETGHPGRNGTAHRVLDRYPEIVSVPE